MRINVALGVILKRLKAIKFMMKDKTVPIRKKALVIFGIVFLFTPVNIAQPFGLIADIILWSVILWYLKDTLDTYWLGEKTVDYSAKFRDRDPIENVEYDIKFENEDENSNVDKSGGSGGEKE